MRGVGFRGTPAERRLLATLGAALHPCKALLRIFTIP